MALRNRQSALPQLNLHRHRFKLVTLGGSTVGKTSLITRFVQNFFTEKMQGTVGAHFETHTLSIEDKIIKLDVWDTAGQERYRSLVPMYYRGSHAALIVYDIQDRESFSTAKNWVHHLREEARTSDIVVALLGNKTDLADRRCISFDEAKNYADANGLIFMETSAKTGINVTEVFLAIAKKLLSECNQRGEVKPTIILDKKNGTNEPWYKCSC